jgi:hypothetical protein
MKKYKILVLWSILVIRVSLVLAVPATNIRLSYDMDTSLIHVEADHPTDRMERYFIRRVVVIKNKKDAKDFYFTRQTKPDGISIDLNYQVEPGDHIEVQLYSTEGGIAQESFDVPGLQPKQKK